MSDPRKTSGKVTVEMTRKEALAMGLLVCKVCGLPPNNHFTWGPSAFDKNCTQYIEESRVGKIVIKD